MSVRLTRWTVAKDETDIQMERLGAVIRERRTALGMTQDVGVEPPAR